MATVAMAQPAAGNGGKDAKRRRCEASENVSLSDALAMIDAAGSDAALREPRL